MVRTDLSRSADLPSSLCPDSASLEEITCLNQASYLFPLCSSGRSIPSLSYLMAFQPAPTLTLGRELVSPAKRGQAAGCSEQADTCVLAHNGLQWRYKGVMWGCIMMILDNGVLDSSCLPGTGLCSSEHHIGSASPETLNRWKAFSPYVLKLATSRKILICGDKCNF